MSDGPIKRPRRRIPDGGSPRDVRSAEEEYNAAHERWLTEMTEAMNALLSQHPKVLDEFLRRLEEARSNARAAMPKRDFRQEIP